MPKILESLLEILLEPSVGTNVTVKELPKDAIPTSSVVDIIVGYLAEQRREFETLIAPLKLKPDVPKDRVIFLNPYAHGYKTPSDIELIERLERLIGRYPQVVAEVRTQAKKLHDEGYFTLDSRELLPPTITSCADFPSYRTSSLLLFTHAWLTHTKRSLNERMRYDTFGKVYSCPQYQMIKLRPLYLVLPTEISNNLNGYENRFVITTGFVIGLIWGLRTIKGYHIDSEGGVSTPYYDRDSFFIIEDSKSGSIEGKFDTMYDTDKTYFKVKPTERGPQIEESSINWVFANLDASKTKHLPVVIGGIIKDGKLNAEMFVTQIKGEKEIFMRLLPYSGFN